MCEAKNRKNRGKLRKIDRVHGTNLGVNKRCDNESVDILDLRKTAVIHIRTFSLSCHAIRRMFASMDFASTFLHIAVSNIFFIFSDMKAREESSFRYEDSERGRKGENPIGFVRDSKGAISHRRRSRYEKPTSRFTLSVKMFICLKITLPGRPAGWFRGCVCF